MDIGKIILITELILAMIFIVCRLFYSIKNDIAMNKRRKQEYIDSKNRLKPIMRDVIWKRG